MGYYRDSVVTKVLGRAKQAYSRPGLNFEERSKALFLLQELVFAAMGSDMFDVRILLRRHYGSFPVRQLVDLVGMVRTSDRAGPGRGPSLLQLGPACRAGPGRHFGRGP